MQENPQQVSQLQSNAWEAAHHGDVKTAAFWCRAASDLARELNLPKQELLCLSNLSEMLVRSGKLEEAVNVSTELLARSRQEDLREFEMRAIGRLVEALLWIDARVRWQEVKPLLEEGLRLSKQLAVDYWQVYLLILMGNGYMCVFDYENALLSLQDASNCIHQNIDDREHLQAFVWLSFALLMLKKENFLVAKHYAEQAVAVAERGGIMDLAAQAELVLAQAEYARGEYAEALQITEQIYARANNFEWIGIEQTSEYLRGKIEYRLGHLDVADKAGQKACELARLMQAKERLVESLLGWGSVLLLLGRKSEACNVLKEAKHLSQKQDYKDHFLQAESWLLQADCESE